jgi:hypothetical protein
VLMRARQGRGCGALDQPAFPDDLQALGEDRFKVFHGAPFHEHVPVAARRLDLLGGGGLARGRRGHRAANPALPGCGELGLSGEGNGKVVTAGAVKRDVMAWCQVRIAVVLVARCPEPGSAKCAFGHKLLPPRRLAILIGNTGYRLVIPAAGDRQSRFGRVSPRQSLHGGYTPTLPTRHLPSRPPNLAALSGRPIWSHCRGSTLPGDATGRARRGRRATRRSHRS